VFLKRSKLKRDLKKATFYQQNAIEYRAAHSNGALVNDGRREDIFISQNRLKRKAKNKNILKYFRSVCNLNFKLRKLLDK